MNTPTTNKPPTTEQVAEAIKRLKGLCKRHELHHYPDHCTDYILARSMAEALLWTQGVPNEFDRIINEGIAQDEKFFEDDNDEMDFAG